MSKEELLKEAIDVIIRYDKSKAEEIARRALAEGMDPVEVINKGFKVGITQVGDLFGRGEIFLPELIQAAEAVKAAIGILTEALPEEAREKKGKIVIGTVEGDVHDIGKSLVVSLLQANGFEVYDLGRDVPIQKFIEKAQEVNADIIGSSALLTTTMEGQRKIEEELRKAGLRDKFKTMVGGAPVTQRWADRIGADAYAEDATVAVKKAQELLSK
ncbi:dimethylamine corrinoid protein 3 [Candidatus Aerophobetes bacterium]|uniref:Dimethylamine corrinoid protein 3 n=1 Tax=Aerophobetes bacterium TaxID=2030807 RepID=A0A662D744_UNCAE|nr:MAG: dimethylamine corrinoid protein 3 [Candidatus Aerophobetes bacterium]